MKILSRHFSSGRTTKDAPANVLLLLGLLAGQVSVSATPVDLPGVDAITYIKDGVQVVEGLDKILKILNPNPAEGLVPKTSMTFSENSVQAVLSLSGGNFGTPDTTQTFSITGTYWSLNFAVTQDAAAVVGFDSVAISGNIIHQKGPHSDDSIGGPLDFSSVIVFGGNQCCGGDFSFHPNLHRDDLTFEGSATLKNIVDPIFGLTLSSDITTWRFALTATHSPIPEASSTLSLLALATLSVCGYRRCIRA